jgi:hypothetical protein
MEALAFAISGAIAFFAFASFANWTIKLRAELSRRPRSAQAFANLLLVHPAPFLIVTVGFLIWLAQSSPVFLQVVGGAITGPVAAAALAYLEMRRRKTSAHEPDGSKSTAETTRTPP